MNPETDLRALKIVFAVMLVSLVFYFVLPELIIPPAAVPLPVVVRTALGAAAGVAAAAVLYIRFILIANLRPAEDARDTESVRTKLRTYYILCYAFSESVGLFGFVLRFMRGTREDTLPLYLGAAALFALCYPRVPAELSIEK